MEKNEENEILEVYREYGYPSAQKLVKILSDNGIVMSLKKIQGIIQKNTQYQTFKKSTAKKVGSHMVAFRPNQIWQADLLDFQKYAKNNHNNRFILIVVDVFTRKAYAVAIKKKTAEDVLNAFKDIVYKAYSFPEKLITDNGNEFLNKMLTPYLEESGVVHETNDPGYHPTLGIIDRFSRTIKEKLFKSFADNKNVIWDTKLAGFINAYNNSPHRSIGDVAPNKVMDNIELVYNINANNNVVKNSARFKKGQLVRIRLARPLFTKGYRQVYSDTVYTIDKVKGVNALLTNGDVVKLNDLSIVLSAVDAEPNIEQKEIEIDKRIDRRVNKEGITRNEVAIKRNLSERKPNQLEDIKYGKIFYS